MHRIIEFGRCLSDPLTVRLLMCLLEKPMTTMELRQVLDVEMGHIHRRIATVRAAELVDVTQEGRRSILRLRPNAKDLLKGLLRDFYEDVSWDPDIHRDRTKLGAKSLEGLLHSFAGMIAVGSVLIV